jgi:mitochondrial fusion and transport protein UGO1
MTGMLLSPLDLVRTRLMVQTFSPQYRNYSGPIDALKQIIRDEGGIGDLYLHPHLLIPSIIDNALRPFVSLALPGLLVSYFGFHVSEDTNPVAWCAFELAGSCIGHLITLPFETIRRRLQVQVRGVAEPIRGCVELRPLPYNGVVDAFYRILTEERSDLPLPHRVLRRRPSVKGKEKPVLDQPIDHDEESWRSHTGLGQLYRGLGMRLTASALVFVLALMAPDDGSSGWTEL